MNTRFLLPAALSCLFLSQSLLSQTVLLKDRYELQGTVAYQYVSETRQFDANLGYAPEYTIQAVAVTPSVGYFISRSLQAFVQPRIGFTRSTSKMLDRFVSPPQEKNIVTTEYMPGIAIGVAYHIVDTSIIIPFVAVSTQISWQKRDIEGWLPGSGARWSAAELALPTITIGAKTFFRQEWAFITQLQISSIQRPSGRVGAEGLQVSVGVGIAAYL